jgi:O-antigen ligase
VDKGRRFLPFVLPFLYASAPLFPAFIALTSVAFPGVSVIPLRAAIVLLALSVVLTVYVIWMQLERPIVLSPIAGPVFAAVGAAALSAIVGFNPHDGLLFVGVLLMGAIWHCAIYRYYAQPGVARAIVWSFMISGACAAFVAIAMVATRIPANQYAIGHGRTIGTFVLPGELAGYLIVFLPIAYGVARVSTERSLRTIAWAALALGSLAFAWTFSRTGWMGMAAAVAFLVVTRVRSRTKGVALAALVVAAGVVAVALAFDVHHNPSEDYTRISIWQAAVQMIDRFPLTGVGPFGFSRIYALVRLPDGDATAFHAHSAYLTFLAELGIVGFGAFVWMWYAFARELVDRLRKATPAASLLACSIAAGLFGTLVQGLIDVVSVVIFGLWFATLAFALAAAKYGLAEGIETDAA